MSELVGAHRARAGRAAVVVVAGVLMLAAGCGPGSGSGAPPTSAPPGEPVAFAGCAAVTRPPASPPAAVPSARPLPGSTLPGSTLPGLTLPCYTAGVDVDVATLRGPAVINLWASWCPPCLRELPVLQRFAERHAGAVHVIGVVSADDRGSASALAATLGLTFPHLYDGDGRLMRGLRRNALPVTLFVDAHGRVREVYTGTALDGPLLDDLAGRHLGTVPA